MSTTISSSLVSCPSWCVSDHEGDIRLGYYLADEALSHAAWVPGSDDAHYAAMDSEVTTDRRWSYIPPQMEYFGASAGELASELRTLVEELTGLAAHLEGIDKAGELA